MHDCVCTPASLSLDALATAACVHAKAEIRYTLMTSACTTISEYSMLRRQSEQVCSTACAPGPPQAAFARLHVKRLTPRLHPATSCAALPLHTPGFARSSRQILHLTQTFRVAPEG